MSQPHGAGHGKRRSAPARAAARYLARSRLVALAREDAGGQQLPADKLGLAVARALAVPELAPGMPHGFGARLAMVPVTRLKDPPQ